MRQLKSFKSLSCLVLVVWFVVAACQKEGDMSFLGMQKFKGTYAGIADISYDLALDTFPRSHVYKSVVVDVSLKKTNGLILKMKYDDGSIVTQDNVLLDKNGIYSAVIGSLSLEKGYVISFTKDSMYYSYGGKCGIPCSDGVFFRAVKIK